jgi:hypothetical protein
VIFKIEAHGNLLVELNEYRSYHFIYLLLTGVVKKQLLPRSGTGKRRPSIWQRQPASTPTFTFSDFPSSAYRAILDVLRHATDDNRRLRDSVFTQQFIEFSQRVVDRLTHHGSSIKWLRADFCGGERKPYGEE